MIVIKGLDLVGCLIRGEKEEIQGYFNLLGNWCDDMQNGY